MKKILAALLAAVIMLSCLGLSSFAITISESVASINDINARIQYNRAYNVTDLYLTYTGVKSWDKLTEITVPSGMSVHIDFGGTIFAVTVYGNIAPLSLKGEGKLFLNNFTVQTNLGDGADSNTPAIRVYGSLTVIADHCTLYGAKSNTQIFGQSAYTGDAVEMATATSYFEAVDSMLYGVQGVDATDDNTHSAAAYTLTNTQVQSSKDTVDGASSFFKKFLNIWFEIMKIILKIVPSFSGLLDLIPSEPIQ